MSNKAKKRLLKFKGFLWQIFSYLMLRHTAWNREWLRKAIKDANVSRLHVGCGHILLPGWLNLTLELREEYGRLRTKESALYLNYNLLDPWPIEENSIDHIAASHFIEHFDLNQGMDFVKRAFKVLKSGGVIRLSCPNLEIYAKNYVTRNKTFFENPLIREWCCFKSAVTFGEIFIAKAYDSGGAHKWFYDFESLKHILEAAGFKKIEQKTRLEGKTPDIEKIDPDKRELETVYVEAVKS